MLNIAINKPSGLQVLPGGLFQQRTVLMQLQWKDLNNTTSCCPKKKTRASTSSTLSSLGKSHISCSVAGILLCAKTTVAKVQLASHFVEGTANGRVERDESEFHKARRISKFYRALVTGVLEKDEFENDLVLIPRETAWFGYYPDGAFSPVLPPQQTKSDGSHSEIEGAASASYTLTCDDQM